MSLDICTSVFPLFDDVMFRCVQTSITRAARHQRYLYVCVLHDFNRGTESYSHAITTFECNIVQWPQCLLMFIVVWFWIGGFLNHFELCDCNLWMQKTCWVVCDYVMWWLKCGKCVAVISGDINLLVLPTIQDINLLHQHNAMQYDTDLKICIDVFIYNSMIIS